MILTNFFLFFVCITFLLTRKPTPNFTNNFNYLHGETHNQELGTTTLNENNNLITENVNNVVYTSVHPEKDEDSDPFFSERYRRVNWNFSDFGGFFLAAFFCMIAAGIF